VPAKGDDLDAAVACAITDNLSNVEFRYTEAGMTHPSNRTLTVPGVFNNMYLETAEGMSNAQPTLSFEDEWLTNVVVGRDGQVGIVGGAEYKVAHMEPSGRGRTVLILRKIDGA